MKNAPALYLDSQTCQRKYSLEFWQTMIIMNRPLNSVIHDDGSNDESKTSNDIKV